MSNWEALFSAELEQAERRHTRRWLRRVSAAPPGRVALDGKPLLNFSSNDYLGLARHPLLVERAQRWAAQYGTGAQSSRLVSGTLDLHEAVEAKIAHAKGTEAALLFASGWQANAAVLPALFRLASRQGEPQIYTDKLNHASLHHGCQTAGWRQIRFRHNDLNHLECLLRARSHRPGPRFIVTESVFSMDGDRCDVPALAELASRHGAFLYLDEAHATGVLGPRGMGLAGLAPNQVDLAMGTFSKAMGSFGAYVAGSRQLCDYLLNVCSGFIYTTALPPPVLGAIDAALDLVPNMNAERAHLAQLADRLRTALRSIGLSTADSTTHIIPAVVGQTERALTLSAALEQRGLFVVAIRPPSVPKNSSRLRLSLSAAHRQAEVDLLIGALRHMV
jgi:8-amino-7-oxononanoate synthase